MKGGFLNIDTEAINDMFTFGGEKGSILMNEDMEIETLMNEVEELASMCLAAMSRERPEDPIVLSSEG